MNITKLIEIKLKKAFIAIIIAGVVGFCSTISFAEEEFSEDVLGNIIDAQIDQDSRADQGSEIYLDSPVDIEKINNVQAQVYESDLPELPQDDQLDAENYEAEQLIQDINNMELQESEEYYNTEFEEENKNSEADESSKKTTEVKFKNSPAPEVINIDIPIKSIAPNNKSSVNAQNYDSNNLKSLPYGEIIVLNKITTKSQKLVLQVGEVKYFNTLSIEINKCINSHDLINPNNFMLITIFDNKVMANSLSVFHGWMMSNNLSISSLEHPVYEIIPRRCFAK